jgi:hypothetical protein
VVCHRRQDGDRSASSLEKTLGYTFRPSIGRANLLISMLPLKKARSPILMRCVITSPIKELSLRMCANLPQQRFHHRLDGHLDFEQSIGGGGESVWAVLGLQHGLIHLAERGLERVDHVRQLRHGIGDYFARTHSPESFRL